MESGRHPNRIRPYEKNAKNHVRIYSNKDLDRPVAAQSGKIQRSERNRFEATAPVGFKTLESVLKIDSEAEIILKLSSERNGFLLLLDQQNIPIDLFCPLFWPYWQKHRNVHKKEKQLNYLCIFI